MLELSIDHKAKLCKVARALSSEDRINIIELLNKQNLIINEIAEKLHLPTSTTAAHIKVLEDAELIQTELRPAKRGAKKVCTRNYDDVHIRLNLDVGHNGPNNTYEISMPIGQFVDFEAFPTCGMASHQGHIIPDDDPTYFYHPSKAQAELIWLRKGYLEYVYPFDIPQHAEIDSLQFSMEICSEAPNYDNQWPSDITVWVNGIEIGTWTCPGDFGDRPGKLNPSDWPNNNTQYGMLKNWRVDRNHATIDDISISSVTLDQLNLKEQKFIRFRIGIKENAVHRGGMNIFGKRFGDHAQDIVMKVEYTLRS